MTDVQVLPEIKQIVGALIFGAKTPVTIAEMKRTLDQVAEHEGGPYKDFAQVSEEDLTAALASLQRDLDAAKCGIHIAEIANGYRMQNDGASGIWLRYLLDKGRGNRLTKPALETLAIIAYRQPCTRGEIEAVRGVAVDQIVRNLMDLQLIKILGRSDLPGRPWLFGTTQRFLEYFGLKNVNDLPGVEELRRMEAEQQKKSSQSEMTLEPVTEDVKENDAPSAQDEEDAMPGRKKKDEEEDEEKEEKEEKDEEEEDEDDDEDEEEEEEEEEEKVKEEKEEDEVDAPHREYDDR